MKAFSAGDIVSFKPNPQRYVVIVGGTLEELRFQPATKQDEIKAKWMKAINIALTLRWAKKHA